MSRSQSARTARPVRRRTGSTVLAGVLVVAMLTSVLGCSSLPNLSSPDRAPSVAASAHPAPGVPLRRLREVRPLGAADGEVPDGVTVFDDDYPAVANLDPALLDALRRAASEAGDDFDVNSGWRSPAYQARLLDEAVSEYGSTAEAARWVATPTTSPHVSGEAVDLGGTEARAWLSEHGDEYGLCQIYRNEPWHYELRPEAVDDGCPAMYDDPTQDPRLVS
jgi:LAS superfamily LD-carboxypeptidase LdcB